MSLSSKVESFEKNFLNSKNNSLVVELGLVCVCVWPYFAWKPSRPPAYEWHLQFFCNFYVCAVVVITTCPVGKQVWLKLRQQSVTFASPSVVLWIPDRPSCPVLSVWPYLVFYAQLQTTDYATVLFCVPCSQTSQWRQGMTSFIETFSILGQHLYFCKTWSCSQFP